MACGREGKAERVEQRLKRIVANLQLIGEKNDAIGVCFVQLDAVLVRQHRRTRSPDYTASFGTLHAYSRACITALVVCESHAP